MDKQVVLIGDQQLRNWREHAASGGLCEPSCRCVVPVAPPSENSWVADFRLQDGMADTENESKLIVEIAASGEASRGATCR